MFVNYAHRGASEYYAENTFSSFYAGLDMGANGIETDVQRTRDGKLVLYHDDTLMRCTGATGKVADYTYEELRQLEVTNAKTGRCDKIVLFEDFLHHFGWRDLTFAIELKGPGAEEKTLALLEKYNMKEKAILTSFRYDYLMKAMAIDPSWRYGWLAQDFSEEDVQKFKAAGGWQLCPRVTALTPEKVAAWNEAGFTVRAWGIRDEQDMAHAHACGTDGQTINFPDKLTAYLKDKE